jgi:predicted PurR-regulated permease PerM
MNRAWPWWIWLIGFVLLLVALWFVRGILLPFVAGMALAYLLDPVCDRLERWGCSRLWATVLVTLFMLTVVIAVLLLVVPLLQAQIVSLIDHLPGYIQTLQTRIIPKVQRLAERLAIPGADSLQTSADGQASQLLGWLSGAALSVLSSGLAIVNLASLLFITPVVTFYLLRDWDSLVARIDSWLPRAHAPVIRELARKVDRTLSGFVRGQALVCLFLAVYNSVGLTVLGLEFGLAIGMISGLLSFIPYVGTIFGFVASVGLAFLQFDDGWRIAAVAGVFIVGQFLEGNILSPKLVGDRIGLHAVWIIFALLAGGALFGFVGLLLALPVAAVIGVLSRFALRRYLASAQYDAENTAARRIESQRPESQGLESQRPGPPAAGPP